MLGAKSFWHDEAFTALMVDLPAERFAEVIVGREFNQALYYLVLRPWTAVFGSSEVALRSLSVLGAMVAVALVVVLGRRMVGSRGAVGAGVVLAVNPFFVEYTQEARSYTLTLAVLAGAGIALCRALERPSTGRLAVYAVVAGLSVYLHFFAGLVVAAQGVGAVVARLPWRRLLPAWGAIAMAFVPVLAFLATVDTDDVDTVAQPSLGSALDVVATMAGGGALLAALVGLAVLAVALAGRRHRGGAVVLAVWLLLPVVATFVFSVAVKPMFLDRFLIVELPALVLLAGAGLARLPAAPAGVALTVVVALSVAGLVDWYGTDKQKDWRRASAFVLDGYQEGDALSFVRPHVRSAFEYYNRRAGDPVASSAILSPPAD
jgi:mannosyltransferase